MRAVGKLAASLIAFVLVDPAFAQGAFRFGPDERAGDWDLSIGAVYLGSESLSGPEGSSASIDPAWGFGFMLGYNFNNHLALGFEMSFLEPDYEYTIVPDDPADSPRTFSHQASVFNGLLRGTYYVLEGRVTPYVDAFAGWRYIDSNVASSPPVTGCWWDPWWGYICTQFWSTYDDTSFSYGAGLGLRWDVSRGVFLRAGWSWMDVDTGSSGSPTFEMGRIEIGWRY